MLIFHEASLPKVVVVVVVLPLSVLLEQAHGMDIADRLPRNNPEIPDVYDVILLSQLSQDHGVFHNVFCCLWGGLAEVLGVVESVCSVRAGDDVHSRGVQGEHDRTWRVVGL